LSASFSMTASRFRIFLMRSPAKRVTSGPMNEPARIANRRSTRPRNASMFGWLRFIMWQWMS